MGKIISASRISWDNDGADAEGPVQGATQPWFEIDGSAKDGIEFLLHAGRGLWAGAFSLSNGTIQHNSTTYTADSFVQLGSARVVRDLFDVLERDSTGQTATSRGYFSGQSGQAGDAGQLLLTQVGGLTLAVAALPGQAGLSTFEYSPGTQPVLRDTLGDSDTLYLADPVGLASVTLDGDTYVYAASSSEPGISAFQLSATGKLTEVGTLTIEDGLWVSNTTNIVSVTAAGQPFLLVSAAGSNSLSVVKPGPDGQMVVVDHMLDDLSMRFDDATLMETLVVGDRTYIAVSGSDNGISLFSLLPNGQLLHLETLEDTQTLGLDSLSALSLSAQSGLIHLVASSETEAGLTHIVYDPGEGLQLAGKNGGAALTGGAADDILLDGDGEDQLTGGAGADLFVLQADGKKDTITDFQIATDRIDVSAWKGLYSTLQLNVVSQSYGVDIRYGDELLILRSANGSRLSLDDLLDIDVLGIARLSPPSPPAGIELDFQGTDDDDSMESDANDNTLWGLAGDDSLFGWDGNDTLFGGDDSDMLFGGYGNDILDGGAGHDVLRGGEGHDALYGGTGADSLYGEGGDDALWGDSSTDVLYGGNGNDTLTGGTGADTLYGGDGDDRLLSNTGVDLLYGGAGDDWISPGNGADLAYGGSGNDTIIGRTGWDTLYGGEGDDELYGSEGVDLLYGDAGDDFLSGGFGYDEIYGGDGNDEIYGNIGNDDLYGGAGNDALYGATGDDLLEGGDGDDVLYGAQGVDTLIGGAGNDFLRGGTLADTFIFDRGHDQDTISGLETQDEIYLSTELTGGLTDAADIVARFRTEVDGQLALSFDQGDMIIFDEDLSSAELIETIFTF
ncbi:hypothetical protein EOK75_20630 (plasmid) [Pseudorhodobacter turbinis]|uniref:Calcium-binding protein n=1 Tax=Pseudorhodobacter turbinis TaxID=2500533 RepID=A0A4V1E1H6_9RHOB|nr:calcium-binding protein [Pseudorhodobacter turbinis]QCO58164.1 hypothetical protein EOK75_20630 [Pseudorhodobacter turbinis]